jgi:hypothetical protein
MLRVPYHCYAHTFAVLQHAARSYHWIPYLITAAPGLTRLPAPLLCCISTFNIRSACMSLSTSFNSSGNWLLPLSRIYAVRTTYMRGLRYSQDETEMRARR